MAMCTMCYEAATLKCQGCLKSVYCSRDCQTRHWVLGHKKRCSTSAINGVIDAKSPISPDAQYARDPSMTVQQLVEEMEKSATVRSSIATSPLDDVWDKLARDIQLNEALARRLVRQLQADPDAIPTLLQKLADRSRAGVFQQFIDVGAVPDLDVTWEASTTPLLEAVRMGKAGRHLVTDLIARGADVNYYPGRGEYDSSWMQKDLESSARRPIISALLLGVPDVIARLTNAGATVDNKSKAFHVVLGRAVGEDLMPGSGHVISYADPDDLVELPLRSIGAFLLVYGMTCRLGRPYLYEGLLTSEAGPGLVRIFRLLGITPAYRIRSAEALAGQQGRLPISNDTLLHKAAFGSNVATLQTMLTLVSNSDLRLLGDHDYTPLVSFVRWHEYRDLTKQALHVAVEIIDRGGADFPPSSRQHELLVDALKNMRKSDRAAVLLQAFQANQQRLSVSAVGRV